MELTTIATALSHISANSWIVIVLTILIVGKPIYNCISKIQKNSVKQLIEVTRIANSLKHTQEDVDEVKTEVNNLKDKVSNNQIKIAGLSATKS